MRLPDNKKKRTAYLGFFLGYALILSYVESLIPFCFGIPGVKLGLVNLAVLLVLYLYGWKEALTINVLRVLLAGFLFGNLFVIIYSMAGALCSFLIMCFMKRTEKFGIAGISMAGGVFHNMGQIGIAFFVTKTSGIMYYIPVLFIAGVLTGLCNGLLAQEMLRYVRKLK